jgi:hypothetical protein
LTEAVDELDVLWQKPASTSNGAITLEGKSIVRISLGTGGAHSSHVRTDGSWVFDSNQIFTFTRFDPSVTTNDNTISGLTGSEVRLVTIGNC